MAPITLFYSYSHEDEPLRDKLEKALTMLRRSGAITAWHDREIRVGEEWAGEIDAHLEAADVILFLVSPDFLASDYCYEVEMTRAMERHEAGEARVVPVFLRACDFEGAPFAKVLGAPTDANPVTSWENQDEAFLDIARAIRAAAEAMRAAREDEPPPPAAALWTIPAPTQTFTGREGPLDDVRAALDAGDRVALTAIAGLGGVGKTQIALEFARRHRADYEVGWYVRAQEPGVRRADLNALAVRLGIAKPDSGPEATMAALRAWWAARDRWLVVYDNAEAAADLRDALPTEGRGHVLITSRSQAWGGVAERVRVAVLPRGEAVDLLIRRGQGTSALEAATDAERAAAGRVAEALGDLPLALEQAAAYVEETGLSFDAYLDDFRQRREKLLAEKPTGDYPDSVATTWSLSVEKAEAECPAAGGLLRLCACLAPDAIPFSILRDWDEPWPGPLDAVRHEPGAWADALRALRRWSLVRVEGDALTVHRLVQAVTLDRMGAEERERWATAAQHRMADAVSVDMATMSGRLDEFAPLIPHALAAAEHEGDDDTRAFLLDRAATYARLRADLDEAEELLSQALAVSESAHGPDHPTVAVRLSNLGDVLWSGGEFNKAETVIRRALAINELTHGPDHPNVAVCLSNLGAVLRHRHDLDGAEAAYRRALPIVEAAHGPNHMKVATVSINLGVVLRHRGNLEGAEAAYRRALAIDEAAYGADHPTVAVCLSNLGTVLRERGDLDGAEAAYRRALAIDEAAYGLDHPLVATRLSNLATVFHSQGDLDGAEDAFRRALIICEGKFGPDHPNTQMARGNLAYLREQT